ncbi:unnamed protein product [Zymoseptoria tritici ST99CH_3D7]|uniref:Uncharacterized protein n=2 Tax=Zymoseptoria tritici TaxID=1047171 RepID=A0A1X7RR05_ZYMT9|nr:unnamed protein product [Zymoseptoria tritici ST99CH_3D7]
MQANTDKFGDGVSALLIGMLLQRIGPVITTAIVQDIADELNEGGLHHYTAAQIRTRITDVIASMTPGTERGLAQMLEQFAAAAARRARRKRERDWEKQLKGGNHKDGKGSGGQSGGAGGMTKA